jgi:hypothetical protein
MRLKKHNRAEWACWLDEQLQNLGKGPRPRSRPIGTFHPLSENLECIPNFSVVPWRFVNRIRQVSETARRGRSFWESSATCLKWRQRAVLGESNPLRDQGRRCLPSSRLVVPIGFLCVECIQHGHGFLLDDS